MRILLTIHSNLDPNTGAPGVTLQLAAELRRRGHIVTLASFDDLPTRLDLRAKSLMFPLLVARRLAGRRLDAFDVVDASTGDAWLWALRRQTRRHRRPVLVTRSHGLEHSGW